MAQIPVAERDNLLQAYAVRLCGVDASQRLQAARQWARYEAACSHLQPRQSADDVWDDAASLGLGRLEAHYFVHRGFLAEDQLLRNIDRIRRSEEHTSELQSLMRISYAVFCLKKKKI